MKNRTLLWAIAGVIAVTALSAPASAMPSRVDDFVNDFAGVISEADRGKIRGRSGAVRQQYSAHIVVVAVNSLEGLSIEEYAHKLFNAWGIGERGLDNGVLLLLVPNGKKGARLRIEVGYGLEGAITDGASGHILDRVLPYYEKGNYSAGLVAGVDMLAQRISGGGAAVSSGSGGGSGDSGGGVDFSFIDGIPYPIVGFLSFGVWLVVAIISGLARNAAKPKSAGAAAIDTGGYSVEENDAAFNEILEKAKKELARAQTWLLLPLLLIFAGVPALLWLLGVGKVIAFICTLALALLHTFVLSGLIRSLLTGLPFGFFYKTTEYYVCRCPSCSAVMEYASVEEAKGTRTEGKKMRKSLVCHDCGHRCESVETLPLSGASASGLSKWDREYDLSGGGDV
ncbi:MAG: TPM domain-containing protein [Chitinispirillales bacterium]|jgi:uncharacterized protein|nr:TPM domain-containing protein [Chitinispirillales bacterium]